MSLHDPQPQLLAVLVAALAYFVVGWLWHGPLFGKTWAQLQGISMDHKPTGAEMGRSLGLGALGTLLTVGVFAWIAEAISGPDVMLAGALEGAGWVWLGFFLPHQLAAAAWEKRPWALAALNAAYALVALLVAAAAYSFLG